LSPENESQQLADALREIQQEARWLLVSRLAAGQGFRSVSLDQTDALMEELQLKSSELTNPAQAMAFRRRLGADLVVAGSSLDCGNICWEWMAACMFADIVCDTAALGAATAWTPGLFLGNVGYALLTSTPLWFAGGYLFGVAMRPVRVEARAS